MWFFAISRVQTSLLEDALAAASRLRLTCQLSFFFSNLRSRSRVRFFLEDSAGTAGNRAPDEIGRGGNGEEVSDGEGEGNGEGNSEGKGKGGNGGGGKGCWNASSRCRFT